MSEPTPRPVPTPAPPADGARELREALDRLEGVDVADHDAVLAAADEAHRVLRARLGHAG